MYATNLFLALFNAQQLVHFFSNENYGFKFCTIFIPGNSTFNLSYFCDNLKMHMKCI